MRWTQIIKNDERISRNTAGGHTVFRARVYAVLVEAMNIRFEIKPHNFRAGTNVVEVGCGNEFIATITPSDGIGVRITSKYVLSPTDKSVGPLSVLEVNISA